MKNFDYSGIPEGYYDKILKGHKGIRKFWHYHKFESVLRYIPDTLQGEGKSILDIGCFAGSFLGMIPREIFPVQLGVDILPTQISYAEKTYGSEWRKFKAYDGSLDLDIQYKEKFHIITLIEVIEHLNGHQIYELFHRINYLLHPEGRLILTTPNYLSLWPLIEYIINHFSEVKYEEQHVTKFKYFTIESQMSKLLNEFPLKLEKKTTTHFLTPFLAPASYELSTNIARAVPSSSWKNPFGSIILSSWKR
jgi:2-polyprenyl-3-methyl-5-hydroxy-6-metoxy-1,4-benzoquinol methylase